MFDSLPKNIEAVQDWVWKDYEPYVQDLLARELTAANVESWLADWTRLSDLIHQRYVRLNIATTLNTADSAAVERFTAFLREVAEDHTIADNQLKQKLLGSGLE